MKLPICFPLTRELILSLEDARKRKEEELTLKVESVFLPDTYLGSYLENMMSFSCWLIFERATTPDPLSICICQKWSRERKGASRIRFLSLVLHIYIFVFKECRRSVTMNELWIWIGSILGIFSAPYYFSSFPFP